MGGINMSERKFDYNNVGTVYNQMKNINDNIKTLLTDTDNHIHCFCVLL